MTAPAILQQAESGRLRSPIQENEVPRSWSDKRERQYEHIKDSYEDRGRSEDKAEELAVRTVNNERSQAGETKSSRKRS